MLTIEVTDVTSRPGGGVVTAAALALAASLGEAVLALRSWAACEVGINLPPTPSRWCISACRCSSRVTPS